MDFYDDYELNIGSLLKKRDLISGSYEINKELASEFINLQLNYRRQRAARNLVENTHYITFNQVFEYIRNIIIDIYSKINNNKIYLYVGDKNKSSYFISVIAVYFIKLHNYKLPEIVYSLTDEILDIIETDNLIIIDDFAYSGSQMDSIISKLYYYRFLIQRKNLPDIHIGLLGATTHALNLLSKINIDSTLKRDYRLKFNKEIAEKFDTPFNIYYGVIYNSLYEILSKEEFIDLLYYFSPLTEGGPYISLYFDHKLADDVSTFTIALSYGHILPSKLYDLGEYNMDAIVCSFKSIMFNYNKEIKYSNEYWEFSTDFDEYIENYFKKIKIDDNINEHILMECIPFINGCNKKIEHIEIIPYFYFMLRNDQIDNYVESDKSEISIHQYIDLLDYIHDKNSRCPSSFYKIKL